ncbi:MAG: DegV family protein [Bacillota bacterium]
MTSIKVITDSTCDLDRDYLNALGVDMVPMAVSFGDETYYDRVTISPSEFYAKLKKSPVLPKTAQIPPSDFARQFRQAIAQGYAVLCICFSSKLSGTYQSACVARDTVDPERITVVDSKAASVGEGLIVKEAAVMAREGASMERIVERVTFMRDHMEHIFAVGSLEMLKKGGRISPAAAAVGTILNVHPILQFEDGAIVPLDKVRGKKGILNKMLEVMEERGENLSSQVIGLNHADNVELCMSLKQAIEERFGTKHFLISQIGATIGSHVGPGTVSVFFLRSPKNKRAMGGRSLQ